MNIYFIETNEINIYINFSHWNDLLYIKGWLMPEQKLNRLQMQLLLQSRIQMLPDSELRKLIHPSISQVILTVGYSVLHETLTLFIYIWFITGHHMEDIWVWQWNIMLSLCNCCIKPKIINYTFNHNFPPHCRYSDHEKADPCRGHRTWAWHDEEHAIQQE